MGMVITRSMATACMMDTEGVLSMAVKLGSATAWVIISNVVMLMVAIT